MSTPERDGVSLTHLDEPLFDGAGATKRDLVDYLEAVAGLILPELRGRPLSVIRVRAGQRPFMQKNLPDYAPPWIRSVTMWAESSRREVRYPLCDDWRTLLWLANQRAVEYHPTLGLAGHLDRPSYLVLDIDPPPGGPFGQAVAAARLIHQALTDAGLSGAVKTSGSKGLHVYVPVDASSEEAAAVTRAVAARAERLDPGPGHHGVHQGRPGGQGLPGLDQGVRRDGGGGVQPAGPPGGPGLVPGALGRPRRCGAGRLHRAHGARAAGRP